MTDSITAAATATCRVNRQRAESTQRGTVAAHCCHPDDDAAARGLCGDSTSTALMAMVTALLLLPSAQALLMQWALSFTLTLSAAAADDVAVA